MRPLSVVTWLMSSAISFGGACGTSGSDAVSGNGSSGSGSGTGSASSSSGAASSSGGSGSNASSGASSGGTAGASSSASSGGAGSSGGGPASVLTNRYDLGRTGVQPHETALTPTSVSAPGKFGLLFSRTVDGTIQAQPLYAQGVTIKGAAHDVVFVATEHNSVFAFDADDPAQSASLWRASLGPSAPAAGAPWTCTDLTPETGVSSTPVLDPSSGTLYAVAETLEGGTYHHQLHALDWTTGSEKAGSPVEITPTQAGWSPAHHFNRVGLLLTQGVVYAAFASHCDLSPYKGWVVGYDAATLAMKGSFATGVSGGIWQSGQGLSSDGHGTIYFVAGVSSAGEAACSSTNLCQSAGSLTLGAGGLTLSKSWTLGKVGGGDLDLTTAFVLGGGQGFVSGKDGFVHVIDPSTFHDVQDLQVSPIINGSATGGHVHGGPVYWEGPSGPRLYVWPEATPLGVYSVGTTGLGTTPVAQNASRQPSHPGPIITLSSNGKTSGTGILWATMATLDGVDTWHNIFPGTLYAFDAEDVTKELWNSETNPGDKLGPFAKFCPPMVANGKVYVGTASSTNALRVYGLLP
jgi:hypothetical protein